MSCCHGHSHEEGKHKDTGTANHKQMIEKQQRAVEDALKEIENGLLCMKKDTDENIALVQKEFNDLLKKLERRRDSLMQQLNAIAADKEQILNKEALELKQYGEELKREQSKDPKDVNADIAKREISFTAPQIIVNIDNSKLSQQIAAMGDVNNMLPPNPPFIDIEEVKAMTCKVCFRMGRAKYDGFQPPHLHLVEIAFAPKDCKSTDDDQKVDFDALKWKVIAQKENAKFIRVKKLKPSMAYYVRAKCQNAYGWSAFCAPQKLVTGPLKINTKIMNSDEIQILMDLIKERRTQKSLEWKLLFRGSDDGFLARTFHQKCDDVPNTICIIESDHGNVFGGFTTLPWKSDVGRYHVDEEAFVFIVRKKKKALKKALIYTQYSSSQHSVVHNKYMGPVFGYGHDIYIRNKADTVDDNSCRNHTYQCSYAGELAGQEKFKVINYEVFQIRELD